MVYFVALKGLLVLPLSCCHKAGYNREVTTTRPSQFPPLRFDLPWPGRVISYNTASTIRHDAELGEYQTIIKSMDGIEQSTSIIKARVYVDAKHKSLATAFKRRATRGYIRPVNWPMLCLITMPITTKMPKYSEESSPRFLLLCRLRRI